MNLARSQGLEPGPAFGRGFLDSGLDTPMLMSRKLNPLRSTSSSFMRGSLRSFYPPPRSWAMYEAYFFAGGSLNTGATGEVSPFRIATAAGGRGLSALASRRLTCHISDSESNSL
jgi:hypothetical protein